MENLKVGQKVRIKSKEWFKNNGFFSSESSISDCYGKEATITEKMAYGYSINIGPKYIFWQETAFEPMGYWSVNMTKDTELKKTVTVNVPNDLDVSTVEHDGKITINVKHKEAKVEEPKFKKGDVIYIEGIYDYHDLAIVESIEENYILVSGYIDLNANKTYICLNNDYDFYSKRNIKSARLATKEEIEKLNKLFAGQKHLKWNAEELKFEKYRWRAEHGERYWYITELGTVISSPDCYSPYDNILYNLRNYFQTEELAKQALPKWKEFLKNLNIR